MRKSADADPDDAHVSLAMHRLGLVVGIVVGAALMGATWLLSARSHDATPKTSASSTGSAEDPVAAAVRRAVLRGATATPEAAASAQAVDEEPAPPGSAEAVMTPEQEADAHAARLEASGTAPGQYLTLTRSLEQEWEAEAKKAGLPLKLSAFRCFAAGCYARATHASAADLETLTSRFTESAGFRDWPGGKFRSGPIVRGTEVEVVWAFFSDESSASPSRASE
jgi:hypothetical protein